MKYKVFVNKDYHCINEAEGRESVEYETKDEAVKEAKWIIDEFLIANYKPHMLVETLIECYRTFGKFPYIVPENGESKFSAWDYAKAECERICNGGFAEKVMSMKETDDETFDEKFYRLLKPVFESVLAYSLNKAEFADNEIEADENDGGAESRLISNEIH